MDAWNTLYSWPLILKDGFIRRESRQRGQRPGRVKRRRFLRPTVVLAQTKKGYGMGHWGQGRMGTHQQKKLDDEALKAFRDRFAVPLSDEDVTALRLYKPADDAPEMKYLHAQRARLGGFLPARKADAPRRASGCEWMRMARRISQDRNT